jgi:hypothetical protein
LLPDLDPAVIQQALALFEGADSGSMIRDAIVDAVRDLHVGNAAAELPALDESVLTVLARTFAEVWAEFDTALRTGTDEDDADANEDNEDNENNEDNDDNDDNDDTDDNQNVEVDSREEGAGTPLVDNAIASLISAAATAAPVRYVATAQDHNKALLSSLNLFATMGDEDRPASAGELRLAIEQQLAGMPVQQQGELREAIQAIYSQAHDSDELEAMLSQLTQGLSDDGEDDEDLELPSNLGDVAGMPFSNEDLLQMLRAIKMEPLSALS